MRPKTVIYLLSLLTIAVALVAGYLAFRNESAKNRLLDAEAPATVDNVDVRRATDPVFGFEHTVDVTVRYSYEIDGEKYERTTRLSKAEAKAFVPWGRGKVCYSQADRRSIEEGKLFPPGHRCGGD